MGATVSLALVIHNHQPVGNFGWVIEDVYERAYAPMLEALERHPGIHIGLHYSGPLLEWMRTNRPQALERIRALAARGQVEIVGGGYYEPILISLPDRDRSGQLVRMANELEALFGVRPHGAWLAERVWEPSLPFDLAAAGYGWTVLDDSHLRAASVPEDEMWTAFTTDDRGLRLTLFGTEQGLRYRIPFKPVDDLIEYLRGRRTEDGRFVGMMGDDGEKFGAWPGTYEYCWSREHWVDRLFEAIERNSDWLSTVTPSEWLARRPPTRRVYVPDASYLEMTEWALPADESPTFTRLVEAAFAAREPGARFLRGGFWRNFAARYREINELHKQMLRASAKVEAMADGPDKALALDHLYQGQSNDCYWHGLFGGIYIVHMRMATLAHLVAAEDLADRSAAAAHAGRPYGAWLEDTNLDAVEELLVASPGQTIVVDPAAGAGISSWDLRASRVALASVLRRRPEAYHERLLEHERASARAAASTASDGSDAPRTIHDIVTTKEPGLAARLHYDRWERRSALVHLLPASTTATDGAAVDGEQAGADEGTRRRDALSVERLAASDFEELGDFVDSPFELVSLAPEQVVARRRGSIHAGDEARPLVVTKTFRFRGDRLEPGLELVVTIENPSSMPLAFELALEWNLNLLGGGHNPAAYYEQPPGEAAARADGAAPAGDDQAPAGGELAAGEPVRTAHDGTADLPARARLAFGNEYEGVRVEATATPVARMTWYPVETISNSEAGFERVYQGSCLLFRWPVELATEGSATFGVRFDARQHADQAADEVRRAADEIRRAADEAAGGADDAGAREAAR